MHTNENNGVMSSFEMAMVRNRGGSAQRLINSDTESRSTKSVASKKSKMTVDRYDPIIIFLFFIIQNPNDLI